MLPLSNPMTDPNTIGDLSSNHLTTTSGISVLPTTSSLQRMRHDIYQQERLVSLLRLQKINRERTMEAIHTAVHNINEHNNNNMTTEEIAVRVRELLLTMSQYVSQSRDNNNIMLDSQEGFASVVSSEMSGAHTSVTHQLHMCLQAAAAAKGTNDDYITNTIGLSCDSIFKSTDAVNASVNTGISSTDNDRHIRLFGNNNNNIQNNTDCKTIYRQCDGAMNSTYDTHNNNNNNNGLSISGNDIINGVSYDALLLQEEANALVELAIYNERIKKEKKMAKIAKRRMKHKRSNDQQTNRNVKESFMISDICISNDDAELCRCLNTDSISDLPLCGDLREPTTVQGRTAVDAIAMFDFSNISDNNNNDDNDKTLFVERDACQDSVVLAVEGSTTPPWLDDPVQTLSGDGEELYSDDFEKVDD